jgi:hypothetical protein
MDLRQSGLQELPEDIFQTMIDVLMLLDILHQALTVSA